MKRVILAVVGVGLLIGLGLSIVRLRTTTAASAAVKEAEVARALAGAQVQAQDRDQDQAVNRARVRELEQTKAERRKEGAAGPRVAATSAPTFDLNQVMEILVSQATYGQKQAAWNGLKNAGQLDQAIHELEQRMANDPQRPEYVAALGEAYLKKCGTMTDVREQAILAMQADKTLEKALNLDPSNWEARFTRAVGLSYWPAEMNKSPQVVQEFLTLIQQQEGREPQFAQPYIWLGKEYEKAGQAENAAQIWQRGAALFPENKELQNKLVAAQP